MEEMAPQVAVIGAGPVGLFSVFELGMLRMRAIVIDALPEIGGQCAALYPEKPIYDIPALPEVAGAELIERLKTQAAPFHPVYRLGEKVEAVTKTNNGWRLKTSAGAEIEAKAIIIAAGAGAFGPHRPPLEGITGYEGVSVHYMVTRKESFRGKRVVIAGGGDSAVDWALALAEITNHIYFVHRRDKFRAAPASLAKLQELSKVGKIEFVVPYQLSALEGDGRQLTAVTVSDLDGKTRRLEADSLLPFFGLATDLGAIASWGLELQHGHLPVDPATCKTSLDGIFAIGDVVTYPGKIKLILCGFAEAAMAAHAIFPLVHQGEALHFEYSTTKGVPLT